MSNLIFCRLSNFLKNRIYILSKDKLLPVSIMASSGLRKMLILIIFQHWMMLKCWCVLQFYGHLMGWYTFGKLLPYVFWHIMCIGRCYYLTLGRCYCLVLYVVDVKTTRQMLQPVTLQIGRCYCHHFFLFCGRCYCHY